MGFPTQEACTLEVAASPLVKVLEMICKEENKTSISQIDNFISKLFTSIDVDTNINRKNSKVGSPIIFRIPIT